MNKSYRFLAGAAGAITLAVTLTWISSGLVNTTGWFSFLVLLVFATGVAALVLRALQREMFPDWLPALTTGAALLRLFAGVLWFMLLPSYGYPTDVQEAGYIMEDAFQRDTAAWGLAQSGGSLLEAFSGSYRSADQYGGLLFLSASVYRLAGGEAHQPLLVVVLAATASALAVPLGWGFTRRIFDARTAKWAAWIIALFPEAVLLGSSQMREAFIMPLAAAAFYGLAVYSGKGGEGGQRRGLPWLVVPLFLIALISPPFGVVLVGLLAITGFAFFRWNFWRNRRFWVVLGSVAVFILAVLWIGWPQIAPRIRAQSFDTPLDMAWQWLRHAARWQAYLSERSSGWLQKIFDETPDWFNLPFLVAYGVTRPLLPAQLLATSIPAWWAIGVWRSIGWTLMLAVLVYAPILALRSRDDRTLLLGLSLAVWAGVIYASFWGGGDQWDNPRYRVAFVVLQAALTAAVCVSQLRRPDPWMRRSLLIVGAMIGWFAFWYLRRYTGFNDIFGWTVVDLFKIVGAGLLTGVLLVVWDWAAPQKTVTSEEKS